jgi:hypothetical protein
MFRTPRGYGNLNDLQNQMNSNLGYAGRLRELAQEFPQPPEDAMDAMKKGGRVKKFKVKQSNKNIAIAKNIVKVYYDRPRRRTSRRKPVSKPVEEKKVIVQPSQVRPQFVTNVMGGNPGQPIALNEFTKRLGLLEDQLNKPKVLNRMVEEEKKVEIPTFTTTIPDVELKEIEKAIEEQPVKELEEPPLEIPSIEEEDIPKKKKKQKPILPGFISIDELPEPFNTVSTAKNKTIPMYYRAGSMGAKDPVSYYQMGYNLDKKGNIKSYQIYKEDGTAENYATYVKSPELQEQFRNIISEYVSNAPKI